MNTLWTFKVSIIGVFNNSPKFLCSNPVGFRQEYVNFVKSLDKGHKLDIIITIRRLVFIL